MPVMPPAFRPNGARPPAEAKRQAERRRGTARERGYDARWDRRSAAYRRRHPLCLGCQAVGKVEPATVTDHVIPHKGDPVLFWDEGDWQPACGWHHDVVKQRLEASWARGEIGADQLRLDSRTAVDLTRRLSP